MAGKSYHTPRLLAALSHEPENLKIEMGSHSAKKAESRMDSPLNINLEGIFADDVTMGSYVSPLVQEENGLACHDGLDAFKFGN